ncbi:MAG: carbon starvation protein A, partial [Muribaculaceae bacterium]|nr:carbon starvation protein A [Muribaculaceae bacterium]
CGPIVAGGGHEFISAMMSVRSGGRSLPELVGRELGNGVRHVMLVFSVVLLVLVGAVFVLTPSGLLAAMTPPEMGVTFWSVVIFIYYILATMLPIDKLIGNLYPLFGGALLFMAVALMAVMLFGGVEIPDGMSAGIANRHPAADSHPVFPMLFISIACGAISGFHATQSPMMARCITSERLARPVFYGAMVAEGIVALIWAAAAITFTGGYDQLAGYMADGGTPGSLVHDISIGWLGTFGGILAIIGVVAAPITTGDTALRSARLIIADFAKISQTTLWRRALICVPLFAVTFGLMMIDFNVLWRYFAWSNQTLAVFTLWAATVYLARHGRFFYVTLVPAVFMTVVTVSYLLVAPVPEGFGLEMSTGVGSGCAVALLLTGLFVRYLRNSRSPLMPEAATES